MPSGQAAVRILMNLAEFARRPDDEQPPPDKATHVLAYIPPYLIKGSREGLWELLPADLYEFGEPLLDSDWSMFGAPNLTTDCLARFAAGILRFPVALELRHTVLYSSQRPLGTRELIYYVRPR